MARGSDDQWVRGILSRLPRQDPPSVSLDAILEAGRRRRTRQLLVGGGMLAAAAVLLLAVLRGSGPAEPPVHLDLQIVDVQDQEQPQTDTAAWVAIPREVQGP